MAVLLETTRGDFVVDLHTDLCPVTCKNFLKLCKYVVFVVSYEFRAFTALWVCRIILTSSRRGCVASRTKYYNNVLFHSVQKDFIVQTGDPTGTGKGGESVYG